MERWKTCIECPDYDISNRGRVRNNHTGYILKTNYDNRGLERVILYDRGIRRQVHIHRLVAEHFVDGADDTRIVIHKDDDKTNNNANNLEWVDNHEYRRYLYENGICSNYHLQKRIRCVETGDTYNSIQECSASTGLNYRVVSRCVNNPYTKTRGGLHFEPVD